MILSPQRIRSVRVPSACHSFCSEGCGALSEASRSPHRHPKHTAEMRRRSAFPRRVCDEATNEAQGVTQRGTVRRVCAQSAPSWSCACVRVVCVVACVRVCARLGLRGGEPCVQFVWSARVVGGANAFGGRSRAGQAGHTQCNSGGGSGNGAHAARTDAARQWQPAQMSLHC